MIKVLQGNSQITDKVSVKIRFTYPKGTREDLKVATQYCSDKPENLMRLGKEKGKKLADEPQDEEIPEITEIDELQTFVGCKKNKFWIWTVVNHWNQGILLWTVGDRSHRTFERLWQIIKCWGSFWYVTDGWKVYPMYIQPEDHLVSKTYMTPC